MELFQRNREYFGEEKTFFTVAVTVIMLFSLATNHAFAWSYSNYNYGDLMFQSRELVQQLRITTQEISYKRELISSLIVIMSAP